MTGRTKRKSPAWLPGRDLARDLEFTGNPECDDQSVKRQRFDEGQTKQQEDKDSRPGSGVTGQRFHSGSGGSSLSDSAKASSDPQSNTSSDRDGPVALRGNGGSALSVNRHRAQHHYHEDEQQHHRFAHFLSYEIASSGWLTSVLG